MRKTVLVLLALLAPAHSAVAQGDLFAAAALASTPIGALTPLMTSSMVGRQFDGAQLAIRYGLRRDGTTNTHAIAGSAVFSAGLKSSLSLTAGVRDATCTGCSPRLMLGLGGDMRLYEGGDVAGAGSGLAVSLSGDLGYGRALSDEDAYALGIGTPVTLSLASGGRDALHIVPFFTPVVGIGQTSCPSGLSNCERSGVRMVLGGGVGVWNPMTSVSASLGVNQVIRDGENPVFGINVVLGGRRRRH
jgi:hypothetical protein